MYQYDPASSGMIGTQKFMDLTLYFREIEIKKTKSVSCIQIYQNSLYLGTKQFQVYAYDIQQCDELLTLQLINQRSFPAQCTAVQFIVASQKLLVVVPSKEQQLIRIWNRQTLQLTHGYYGHQKQISSVIFLKDAKHLVSCSYDCTVRIWDISDRFQFDKQARKYTSIFPLLTLTELDQTTLAFGGDDCLITVWDWRKDYVKHKFYAHLGSTTTLATCRSNLLYSAGGDSKIKVWSYGQQKKQGCLKKQQQFKKKLNQNVFTTLISNEQILIIDSRGHIYLMNGDKKIGSSKLKINYSESIRSAKLWRNRLFVILNKDGKGQLKQIAADFEQLRRNAHEKIQPKTIKSIQINQMNNLEFKIVWKKLTLTDPKTGTKILNHLNGYAQSGEFITIMGPSGAGKSSLLSILACRLRDDNSKLQIQGHYQINGENYGLNEFSKYACYVQQDDILFGSLTVKETFLFHSQLKLWNRTPKEQQQISIQLLKKLNLFDCADVLVGNSQFKKCISGGQKKRVAIGIELLSNPKILVFDQPTSGLDSHNALIITRLLSKLAKEEKKLIIATIHQPSTLMFQQMDKLYVMKSGECIYSGFANKVVDYMRSLHIQVNYHMNPADFLIYEISKVKQQKQDYQTPLNHENCAIHTVYPQQYHEIQSNRFKPLIINQSSEQIAPFCKQFQPLFMRSFKNFYRTPSNQLNKLVTAIIIPIFLGVLYKSIGNRVSSTFDQSFLFDFFCYIFMAQYFVFAMNIYDTILVFPIQKEIVCKQTGANLYNIIIYFVARLSTEIFGCIAPASICGVLIYLAGDLNLSVDHFGTYMAIFILLALAGYLFGLMFGVLNKDSQRAITLLPLAVIPILIFGGLVINIHDIPIYAQWLQYLTPLRHAFMIVFQNQLQSPQFAAYVPYNLPQKYGLDGNSSVALGCLIALILIYLIVSVVLLIVIRRKL